jgi:hypothetical protein
MQGSAMRIGVQIHIQCVDMEDCPLKHRTNFAWHIICIGTLGRNIWITSTRNIRSATGCRMCDGKLDINKRLTNHSARTYLLQKLREHNVEGTDIMQISGHKNIASINNYSKISEEKHKQISKILSNTETNSNSNALVPITVVSNLSRTTSTCTHSTANIMFS